jgi:hypothetical protein
MDIWNLMGLDTVAIASRESRESRVCFLAKVTRVMRGIPWKEGPQPTSAVVALPDYRVIYSKQQDVTTEQWMWRRNPWPCGATNRGHEGPQEQTAGGGVNMIFQH